MSSVALKLARSTPKILNWENSHQNNLTFSLLFKAKEFARTTIYSIDNHNRHNEQLFPYYLFTSSQSQLFINRLLSVPIKSTKKKIRSKV